MTWLLSLWAVMAGAFSLVAVFRLKVAAMERERAQPRVRRRPHVLLLRPVDAPTELELENLAAPIDYAGQVTHYVLAPFRPRLASANVRWLPSDPLAKNRKVGHLTYALAAIPRAPNTVVIAVDADVRVDGALLAGLVDELQNGAALASAAPSPEVGKSLASRCVRGLLLQSHHAFRALDVMSAGAKAVCGKALGLSTIAIEELAKLGDCIGEDLELSHVLHQRGLHVSMTPAPAIVPQAPNVQLKPVIERFTRWMQVLRAHRPSLFPSVPLFFTPTPVLMVAASVLASPGLAAALCFLVGARIVLAGALDKRPGWRFEWLLAELLLLGCWLSSLWLGNTVRWRGRGFALQSGGRMRPLLEEST